VSVFFDVEFLDSFNVVLNDMVLLISYVCVIARVAFSIALSYIKKVFLILTHW